VIAEQHIDSMDAAQLRELTARLLAEAKHKFAAQSERFNAERRSLLDETPDADLQAVGEEIEQLAPPAAPRECQQAKRQPLPASLPRRERCHEPESTTCACGCKMKRLGEDVAEEFDCEPGVFTVERHVRGKWACASANDWCRRRWGRAGFAIPRSTLAQWSGSADVQLQPLGDDLLRRRVLHANEAPVAMLDPGAGKRPRVPTAAPASSATGRSCSTWLRTAPAGMPWSPRGPPSKLGAAR
jgi:transposase